MSNYCYFPGFEPSPPPKSHTNKPCCISLRTPYFHWDLLTFHSGTGFSHKRAFLTEILAFASVDLPMMVLQHNQVGKNSEHLQRLTQTQLYRSRLIIRSLPSKVRIGLKNMQMKTTTIAETELQYGYSKTQPTEAAWFSQPSLSLTKQALTPLEAAPHSKWG